MADRADFLYLVSVSEPAKGWAGISVFLVDTNTPGLKVERTMPVIRPQYSTELVFDHCRISERRV